MSGKRSTKRVRLRDLDGLSIGVVGLGLIGGSLIRRLAEYRPAITVYGTDRDVKLKSVTQRHCRWRTDLTAISDECDILILALPVPVIVQVLSELADLQDGQDRSRPLVVMDTGTLKQAILQEARRHKRHYDFVGLHPLAGGEINGWAASRGDLFQDCKMIVFPGSSTRANRMAKELTALLGAVPAKLESATHDRTAALTIGLPHALAFAAAGLSDGNTDTSPLRGDSWASLTRVAQSDPTMVAGFFTENRTMQLRTLKQFTKRLQSLTKRLEHGDDRGVAQFLKQWGEGRADGT